MNKELELQLLEEIENISFLFDKPVSIFESEGRAWISADDRRVEEYAASKIESEQIEGTRHFDPAQLMELIPKTIHVRIIEFHS